tara:strand:- start:1031 stop:1597 length:567 start_codon:yes stop_codon:yes gene_type:complete
MENKNKEKNEEDSVKKETVEKTDEISLEDKLKEAEDKLLRSLAEIENQRRRHEKELREAFEYGGFNFAKETLTLLDNLQRAQQSILNDETLKESKDLDKFINNIKILENDIISIFEKNKIKKINCLKEKFDPNLHQAMLELEDESNEPGIVVQEIQPGYMFGERLLRPAFVGVSKKKNNESKENKEKK